MPYKVYNELPGVGTTAKTLFSVIYYNVYNLTNLAQMVHQEWRKGAPGCNTPHLAASRHQERRKGAPAATLHAWQHRGTPDGRKGCTAAILHAWQHRGTKRAQNKKPAVKRPPVSKPFII